MIQSVKMMTAAVVVAGLSGLLAGAENAPPNVLLIYVDDMGPWKLHLPRQAAHRVYWAQHPKKKYMNLDHAALNNLADDISEKGNLTDLHPVQTKELQKLAAETRSERGDWNVEGTDRPVYSYPGNLNNPNWKQKSRPAPASKQQSRTR